MFLPHSWHSKNAPERGDNVQKRNQLKKRWFAIKIPAVVLSIVIAVTMTVIPAYAISAQLIPIGRTAGIKMFSQGIMLVKLSPVETQEGQVYPAKKAGLLEGDMLLEVNGQTLTSNEQLQKALIHCDGAPVNLRVKRDGKTLNVSVKPVKSSSDGLYKIGVFVRDSMAGIGTITFVDPATHIFGSLGHGICDIDTGILMPLASGSVMEATVKSVKRGEVGSPGELQGDFNLKEDMGNVVKNTDAGIYGVLYSDDYYKNLKAVSVASKSEVKTGPAQILSNVAGDRAKLYSIEIQKIYPDGDDMGRSMSIRITDPELLQETGGIVQGMSGSPVLQNGKLVGAVTHVLVNDPHKGYAIFIENMLKEADNVSHTIAA